MVKLFGSVCVVGLTVLGVSAMYFDIDGTVLNTILTGVITVFSGVLGYFLGSKGL